MHPVRKVVRFTVDGAVIDEVFYGIRFNSGHIRAYVGMGSPQRNPMLLTKRSRVHGGHMHSFRSILTPHGRWKDVLEAYERGII